MTVQDNGNVQGTEDAAKDAEVVDEQEVIPARELDGPIQLWRDEIGIPRETLPIHQAMLLKQLDPGTREALANAYFGVVPRGFDWAVGRDLLVLGMAVYEHGPYKGKDGKFHPEGYYKILILTASEDEDENFIVVQSSGNQLAHHVLNILRARGWYLFPEPITYHFAKGANNAHFIYNRGRDLKRLLLAPPSEEAVTGKRK